MDLLPFVILGAKTVVAVEMGNFYTCAILNDGTAKCWGYGANGRLGTGSTSNVGDGYSGSGEMGDALAALDLGTGRTAVSVSAALKDCTDTSPRRDYILLGNRRFAK